MGWRSRADVAQLLAILTSQGLLALLATSTLAVTPLFAFAPVESGGLGWQASQIGYVLGVRGVSLIVCQVFLFPPLCNRVGAANVFRMCAGAQPPQCRASVLTSCSELHCDHPLVSDRQPCCPRSACRTTAILVGDCCLHGRDGRLVGP